jgi:lactoylglutathione lyase
MTLEHVAIWTDDIEKLKDFYCTYFGGIANDRYVNETKKFQSYFITFGSGTRLELMSKTGIPHNLNDTVEKQHTGIIHLAFGVSTTGEVDAKAMELKSAGFIILSGPRRTGDGYYEFETLDPDNNRIEVTSLFS